MTSENPGLVRTFAVAFSFGRAWPVKDDGGGVLTKFELCNNATFGILVPQCLPVIICTCVLCFSCNFPHISSKWRFHSCSDCNRSIANVVSALLW